MLPKSVIDLLFGWSNWIGKHSLDTWNLVPLCVMQTLWKKGNCRTFDNSESLVTQLKYCVLDFWLIGLVHGALPIAIPLSILKSRFTSVYKLYFASLYATLCPLCVHVDSFLNKTPLLINK